MVIVDNMAAKKSTVCNPSSASDIAGVPMCASLADCYEEIIENQGPCSLADINAGLCLPRSVCPTITAPINTGDTVVSGTTSEADGTTIRVYKNNSLIGTTTSSGGAWSLTGISPALASNDIINATAQASGEIVSTFDCNTTTVGATCSAPPISAIHCGKSISGQAPVAGAVINVYFNNSAIPLTATSGTVYSGGEITVSGTAYGDGDPGDNFLWKCTGTGPSAQCNASGPACLADGVYKITATEPGKCESTPIYVCINTIGDSATPIISTSPITTATTSVSGTMPSPDNIATDIAVMLYVNDVQVGSTTTTTGGAWTIGSLTLNACDVITAKAIRTGSTPKCISNASTAVNVIGGTTGTPQISGTYCVIGAINTVNGISGEADGTTISVFENGILEGTTTVSSGAWTLSGIMISAGSTITATATASGSCKTESAISSGVLVASQSTNTVAITTDPIIEQSTTISGTGTSGDIITLYVDDFQVEGVSATVSGGIWTISGLPTYELYTGGVVTVKATSPGSCESAPSTSKTVECIEPLDTLTVNPDNAVICSGSFVSNIDIVNSENLVIYQLYLDDEITATGSSILGNGSTITLTSGVLTSSTTLKVKALKLPPGSCEVFLTDNVPVTVNPIPDLGLTVDSNSPVCSGTSADITVDASETGVSYQLRNDTDDSNVGTAVIGDGNTINLPTGNLTSDTTFNILATGVAPSNCSGELTNKVTVTIAALCCNGGTIAADQTVCFNTDPAAFTSTAAGSVSSGTLAYQWQISTTDCTTGFTDISGATSETYDHPTIFTTSFFRRVTTNGTDCTELSNCLTIIVTRLGVNATVTDLSCADGPNDGAIDISVDGAVGAYTIDWAHIPGSPDPSEDLTGLAAGTYTITVNDTSGCPAVVRNYTVGTIENPYAALLLTGTQGASPFPTTDYPSGTFPPDAVIGGEPGGYNQTYPTGTEKFDVTFDNYYIPADYIIDPDWAGSATLTYTQDHAGTESGAFFAAGSRETEFSDFGPGSIANNSGNEYYVYGRGLNGFGSTGFVDGWTLTYDFSGLVNGYLPAGTIIAVTDVDGLASGGENVILNATLVSGATTAWASYFDNSLTTPPHGAPIYDSGTNSYNYASVSGANNGNWVLVTTEDLLNVSINVTNNGGGSIGLKLAAPLVPIDVTLTGTDNTICFGAGVDGSIQVDILGNVGPYDIAWNNGTGESGSTSNQTSPYTISSLPVGTYTVTVSSGACSAQETVTLGCPDLDNDGIANIADLDDDNDGVLDLDESGTYDPDGDEDGDGIANWQDTTDDGTGDGSPTNYTDANGDGVPDVYDFDGDGAPNHLDLDSDNDGCSDSVEAGATADTTTDFQYPNAPVGTDGVPDAVQITSGAESGNVDYTIIETNAGTYDFLDVSISVACGADLSLTKTIDNSTPKIGETITYTITITNSGPTSATGVQVKDILPTGLIFDLGNSTIPAGTSYDDATGIWDFNAETIANGESYILQIAARITPACGEITNVAEIISNDKQDPDSITNNGN